MKYDSGTVNILIFLGFVLGMAIMYLLIPSTPKGFDYDDENPLGFYSQDNESNGFYCVWTQGLTQQQIDVIDNHELTHALIARNPGHYCAGGYYEDKHNQ